MIRKSYCELSRQDKSKRRKTISTSKCSNSDTITNKKAVDNFLFDDPSLSDNFDDNECYPKLNENDQMEENLRDWATEFNISHIAVTALLRIVEMHKCFTFPSDARTLGKTMKNRRCGNVSLQQVHDRPTKVARKSSTSVDEVSYSSVPGTINSEVVAQKSTGLSENCISDEFSALAAMTAKIDRLQVQQELMTTMMSDTFNILTRLENRSLDQGVTFQEMKELPVPINDEDYHLQIDSLPLASAEDFAVFDSEVKVPQFREQLLKSLKAVWGKDVHHLTIQLMQRFMKDNLAEIFSLTGRTVRDEQPKAPFSSTEVYKLIFEICGRVYPDTCKENIIKQSMSKWLQQAKFRRTRREIRQKNHYGNNHSPT